MKIAFDVDVIKDLGVTRMVHQVAEWGYKYIEQSPHPQINPFYKHPRASREIMAEYKQALRDTGLELSSFICVYRWSGPTEEQRQHAVLRRRTTQQAHQREYHGQRKHGQRQGQCPGEHGLRHSKISIRGRS